MQVQSAGNLIHVVCQPLLYVLVLILGRYTTTPLPVTSQVLIQTLGKQLILDHESCLLTTLLDVYYSGFSQVQHPST